MEEKQEYTVVNEDREYAYEMEEKYNREEREKFNEMFYQVFRGDGE